MGRQKQENTAYVRRFCERLRYHQLSIWNSGRMIWWGLKKLGRRMAGSSITFKSLHLATLSGSLVKHLRWNKLQAARHRRSKLFVLWAGSSSVSSMIWKVVVWMGPCCVSASSFSPSTVTLRRRCKFLGTHLPLVGWPAPPCFCFCCGHGAFRHRGDRDGRCPPPEVLIGAHIWKRHAWVQERLWPR